MKPLYGNGGAGVFRITESDQNLSSLLEMFDANFREPFIAQRYLSDVRSGDKRIILVDGVPVGALNRVPAPGDARSKHACWWTRGTCGTDKTRIRNCERIAPAMRETWLLSLSASMSLAIILPRSMLLRPPAFAKFKNFLVLILHLLFGTQLKNVCSARLVPH